YSRPQRDPRSFPTRRSSDLDAQRNVSLVYPQASTTGPGVDQGLTQSTLQTASGHVTSLDESKGGAGMLGMFERMGNHRQGGPSRSEEHTSELQSRENLVCRL